MAVHNCKFHDYAHEYVKHDCGHEYCPYYWQSCPRCHGRDSNNRILITAAPSSFHVGQKVNVKAYTDCFGKQHEAVTGMTVVEMEHINTESIVPYYRIKAIGKNGKGYFYAADRFFEVAA